MLERFDEFLDLNIDSQFLAQLAPQAFFITFIRLAFATGKFPKPAQMDVRVAARDEKFPVAKNQTSGNLYKVLSFEF